MLNARRPSGERIIAQIHFRNGYLFFLLLRLAEGTTSKASCWLAVYTQNKRTRTEENKEGCADTTDSTQGKVYNGTRLSGVLLFVFTFVKWGLSLLTETLWGEKNKKKSFLFFRQTNPENRWEDEWDGFLHPERVRATNYRSIYEYVISLAL